MPFLENQMHSNQILIPQVKKLINHNTYVVMQYEQYLIRSLRQVGKVHSIDFYSYVCHFVAVVAFAPLKCINEEINSYKLMYEPTTYYIIGT